MRRSGLVAVAALFVSAPALATIEDSIGIGPRDTALGGSYAARPGDFAAAYYNPAGLAPNGDREERGGFFELTAAYVFAHPSLHVTRDDGSNVSALDTPDSSGIVLGSRFSVGQPFHVDGLDMGLALYAPSQLFRWQIAPDDDVQWALMTDRTQELSFHSGLAYRVTPWLSVGAGVRVLFDVQTLTIGRVTSVESATDPKTGKAVVRAHTQLGTDAQVFGRVSPLFGVLLTPIERLRIGLSYRQQSYVDDWGYTRITGVPGLGNLGYSHRIVHYFEPSQATLALGAELGAGIDASFDLIWSRWSAALSTNRDFFGAGHWGDSWTPAGGVRWRASRALALSGGYRFQRSPLDNFGGPSNLLDTDRHVLSTGFELDLGELLDEPGVHAALTTAIQHALLVERREQKDYRSFASDEAWQENPGYPGYSYGGHMTAVSVGLEAKW